MTQPLRLLPDIDPDTGEFLEPGECSECAKLRGQLLNLEQDNRRLEKDLRSWRRKYEAAMEDKDARLRSDKHYPMAMSLIEEWKRECGHPNASETDPKRMRLALSVVKRYAGKGGPEGERGRAKLSLVIQHGKHLAFRDPDTGFKYDEFGRLFGSSDEIERRASQFWLWAKRQKARSA